MDCKQRVHRAKEKRNFRVIATDCRCRSVYVLLEKDRTKTAVSARRCRSLPLVSSVSASGVDVDVVAAAQRWRTGRRRSSIAARCRLAGHRRRRRAREDVGTSATVAGFVGVKTVAGSRVQSRCRLGS